MAEKLVDHSLVVEFMEGALVRLGVPEDDARIQADVLITSDLRGIRTHGVSRFMYYYIRYKRGQHRVRTQVTVIKDSGAAAVLDGNHGVGQVVSHRAMGIAIGKAREYGIGSVAVRNSNHFGIAGYYPMMAAGQGCVGIAMTNARPAITPTFSVEPMMGTNPIAVGLPTDEEFPFVFDAATSIIQRGVVEEHDRKGKALLEGWLTGQGGRVTLEDPAQVLRDLIAEKAAMLPLGGQGETMGGHKGYGLANVVELFCAAFQDGAFLKDLSGLTDKGEPTDFRVGHFFMALDPEHFMGLEAFRKVAGSILRALRKARKAPAADRIFTAGEKEHEAGIRNRQNGIPVDDRIQQDILTIKKELGMETPRFPFE